MATKRRGAAAADSSLTRIKAVKCYHANEMGEVGEHQHTLYLDKRDVPSFVLKVPSHVRLAMDCEEQVNKPTAEAAISAFEKILRDYTEWVKNAKCEKVVVLKLDYSAYEENGESFSNDRTSYMGRDPADRAASVDVTYLIAFRVGDKLYASKKLDIRSPYPSWGDEERKVREQIECDEHNARERRLDLGGGRKLGSMLYNASRKEEGRVVLPYTEELHAKLDMIIEALSGAARVLRQIAKSEDAGAMLLSLGSSLPLLKG